MLKIKTRNLEQISKTISELPRAARGLATRDASFYLMGNASRGLKHYPPQRAGADYKRTDTLRFGWQADDWEGGAQIKIVNAVPYAPFVQGDNEQAWMHKGIWRTVSEIIESNVAGMLRAIEQSVNRWIKSRDVK